MLWGVHLLLALHAELAADSQVIPLIVLYDIRPVLVWPGHQCAVKIDRLPFHRCSSSIPVHQLMQPKLWLLCLIFSYWPFLCGEGNRGIRLLLLGRARSSWILQKMKVVRYTPMYVNFKEIHFWSMGWRALLLITVHSEMLCGQDHCNQWGCLKHCCCCCGGRDHHHFYCCWHISNRARLFASTRFCRVISETTIFVSIWLVTTWRIKGENPFKERKNAKEAAKRRNWVSKVRCHGNQ